MKKLLLITDFPDFECKSFCLNFYEAVVMALFLFVSIPYAAYAAGPSTEPGFHPHISVEEEYNDNINLTSRNEVDDFITTVKPGIRYYNMDSVSGIDLDYTAGFVFYDDDSKKNYVSHNGSLNLKYLTKEHFNFYFKDNFIRSDDPREREYFTLTEENKYVLSTKTERQPYWRNVAAPTVEYQFGPENRVGVNYRSNIYQTESITSEDSREDYVNPYFAYSFDAKNGIYLEYGYTIGHFERSSDLKGHRGNTRFTHRFDPKLSVFGEYTFSRRNFDPPSVDYDTHEPSVGISYAFSPVLNGSVQAGYFVKNPETGSKTDGFSYRANIANRDVKTSYVLSLQGGYNEDFFTSENLGFSRYHRLTGSVTHSFDKRTSVGLYGNGERAEFDADRKDWIWGIGATASYNPLKWLMFSLDVSHKNRDSNVDINDYTENRGIVRITASY
jgi:hypothetical protein